MVKKKRHVAKALTWRAVGTVDSFGLAWFLTGSIELGAAFSAMEFVTKTILFIICQKLNIYKNEN